MPQLASAPNPQIPSEGTVPKPFEGGFFVREPLPQCLSLSKGGSSSENLYPTLRHQASVPAIAPLLGSFRMSGNVREDLRHVLKGVSRPRGAVYPIASLPRSPRSVHPVIAAAHGPRWRARGVKLWDVGGQVHRGQDLLRDVLGLDECDQAERGLALRAEEFKATDRIVLQPASRQRSREWSCCRWTSP